MEEKRFNRKDYSEKQWEVLIDTAFELGGDVTYSLDNNFAYIDINVIVTDSLKKENKNFHAAIVRNIRSKQIFEYLHNKAINNIAG